MIYKAYNGAYDLIPNRVNKAINDILFQLRTASKDIQGKNLLKSADRLLNFGMENDIIKALQPPPLNTPCVRTVGGQRLYNIQAVDFVRLDGLYKIPLYFIYYDKGSEDFEDFRESHIDFCIRWLEAPDDDNPTYGMERGAWQDWGFMIQKWQCTIDHDTPLRYISKTANLPPPYYCSRVDLMIQTNQVGAQQNDGNE